MKFRVPAFAFGFVAAISLASIGVVSAQDDPIAEINALKKVVEEQGKQIAALSAQVAELVAKLEPQAAEPSIGVSSPPTAPLVATPLPVAPEGNVYVIEKGDSLEKIAKSCGTTTAELQKLNNIADPNKVRIGQKILLPAGLAAKEEQ